MERNERLAAYKAADAEWVRLAWLNSQCKLKTTADFVNLHNARDRRAKAWDELVNVVRKDAAA